MGGLLNPYQGLGKCVPVFAMGEYELLKPRLSVIVLVYNVEKYISRCLDSVIKQSYNNLEIIVVNDGTKDRSAEIAKAYAQKG